MVEGRVESYWYEWGTYGLCGPKRILSDWVALQSVSAKMMIKVDSKVVVIP